MKLLAFLIFFLFLNAYSVHAQDITQHQWKNRIIILIANSFENESLQKQIEWLSKFPKEQEERKLVQYEISPKYYRFNSNTEHTELGAATLFKKYNPTKKPFKIILIGLDGGIKLEKDSPIAPTKILELIDTMPMRKSELKNN